VKELLFSITAKDCRWDYYRGSGAGGQHRNKTNSAVRCTHEASGAMGQSEDTRSQHDNKKLAFVRMAKTDTFQKWARIEACRVTGKLSQIEEWVERELTINTRIEKKENGKWVNWKEKDEVQ
jgi:protein subunit release factor A